MMTIAAATPESTASFSAIHANVAPMSSTQQGYRVSPATHLAACAAGFVRVSDDDLRDAWWR